MATTIVNNFISPRTPTEMLIDTTKVTGVSTPNNQYSIYHDPAGVYNYLVDWGDGTSEIIRGGTSPIHIYSSPGVYVIKIWGKYTSLSDNRYLPSNQDAPKIIEIRSIDKRAGIDAVRYERCVNLVSIAGGETIKLTFFRINAPSLTSLSSFDTTNVTNMNFCFLGALALTQFPWINTLNVVSCSVTWKDCRSLTSFPLLDLSNCKFFQEAWMNCLSLTSFPQINVNKGTIFGNSWRSCTSLADFPANMFDNWTGIPLLGCFVGTWRDCISLTAQSVENILVSIDTSGQSAPAGATGTQADISITYNVATGALSSATNTAITNLKAKGWKPHINKVYV